MFPCFACRGAIFVFTRGSVSFSGYETAVRRASAIPRVRLDTYVDKVQGAWVGKMIGVTFGQPSEFEYLGTPIGFDITDWSLSPTRMKSDRGRSTNKTDYDEPITNEGDNQKVHINRQFIETSEKEHPSFGSPDNDDTYINLLFLYCLRR